MLDISMLKSVYDMLIYYNNKQTKTEKIILDPLTTMCKLALMAFKPIGTKLGFDKNKIILQEPARFQGLWRTYYGNNKDQIHFLLTPITRAIKRYPITNPNIKIIYQTSIIGLERLKSTYNNDSSTVVHSLELYIHIISEVLEHGECRQRSNSLVKSIDEDDNSKNNIFSDLWNDKQIEIIANMIKQIETQKHDNNSYVDAIDTILITQEDKAMKKIIEITDSL